MKRHFLLALIGAATLLAGCASLGAPAPTYTPLPTYTLQPTFTQPPTATATFLPSPTSLPTSTETPEGGETPTQAVTPTSSQMQGVLAFGSNLREGPGTSFEVIEPLEAGEPLAILGRDLNGAWVYVRTSSSAEGWVAVRQIQGPVDVPRIPLAAGIPTPDPSQVTATSQATARVTGTPPTGTPAASNLFFEIVAGAAPLCKTITWEMPQRFPVTAVNAEIPPFDTLSPEDEAGVKVFQIDRSDVPDFIDPKVEGNVKTGDCRESDTTCRTVTFTLCAGSPATAPTGGSQYAKSIILRLGTQSYNQLFLDTEAAIPTVWEVVAP